MKGASRRCVLFYKWGPVQSTTKHKPHLKMARVLVASEGREEAHRGVNQRLFFNKDFRHFCDDIWNLCGDFQESIFLQRFP